MALGSGISSAFSLPIKKAIASIGQLRAWMVYLVTFSNNGGFIASGSWDGTNRTWHATTGESVHNLILVVASFPDDQRLLSGWMSGFRIWGVETGN